MATKKSKDTAKLSAELEKVVEELVISAGKVDNAITEDDIQLATAEIDMDPDELSDLYDAIRAKGVEIKSEGEAAMPTAGAVA
ncbi:MAG: RNA polymerase sigma factor RpoD, partial [Atopobiaceae bacterium]|nr:RNA polymerase sigma factor RpoD [Atopobiaceae bacterium]